MPAANDAVAASASGGRQSSLTGERKRASRPCPIVTTKGAPLHSLKLRLLGLWTLSLIASVAVGFLLVQLYRQSTRAQISNARAEIVRACDLIRDRYGFYAAGWSGPAPALPDQRLQTDLTAVVNVALAGQDGVEGGIWQTDAGPLAYAYPTYEGTGPKTDLPAAERDKIQAINRQAARDEQPADQDVAAHTQTLLLHACPLTGPVGGLTAWTMTRVRSADGLRPLQLGLGVLFGLMLLMSVWLGRVLAAWGRHVRSIEAALASAGQDGMPAVPRTGEQELDRIIDALNEAGTRLARARQDSDALAVRVARAERLAGLGRVAAGVAHEIRNPLAGARLQGENALAGDDARRRRAITDMLGQIDRLDALVGELLAMTQRVDPRPVRVDLAGFLHDQASRHAEIAAAKHLTVSVAAAAGTALLDPAVIGRVLDNLLTNAIRHAPDSGTVMVSSERTQDQLILVVEDTGSGVPPDMKDRLFEPFVTGRADGTGLGLAIARELADAHQGRLCLRPQTPGRGAVFALELPQDATWPRS
jgi:signal transduction histidine kinase